jgi:hypothetical protein
MTTVANPMMMMCNPPTSCMISNESCCVALLQPNAATLLRIPLIAVPLIAVPLIAVPLKPKEKAQRCTSPARR